MKLIKKNLEKDGAGSIEVVCVDYEDMWHTYNIIAKGDRVKASTVRRVTKDGGGLTTTERVRVTLTLEIISVDFDTDAAALHIAGKNSTENKHVRKGAHHTMDLELNRPFTIEKDHWDSIYLDRIEEACNPATYADVAAIVMQEGLAHVCLVARSLTITRARIEVNIPRKRRGSTTNYEKALHRFYEQILNSIDRFVDFKVVKCVILGSPGFVKDDFFKWMNDQAVKRDMRNIIENKSRFVLVHATSGHKHALNEVLSTPEMAVRLADTKAASEIKALNDFWAMLNSEPDRALYGYNHVRHAADQTAIQTLLVTDGLFRSRDIPTRRKYVKLTEDVKEGGGQVHVFSSLHPSGEQLEELTGIAALCRFPLPDIDEIELGEGDPEDTDEDNDLDLPPQDD